MLKRQRINSASTSTKPCFSFKPSLSASKKQKITLKRDQKAYDKLNRGGDATVNKTIDDQTHMPKVVIDVDLPVDAVPKKHQAPRQVKP